MCDCKSDSSQEKKAKSERKPGLCVIGRRVHEGILIGENIEIWVSKIKGKQVNLGVKAPKDMKISRAPYGKGTENEEKKPRE